MAAGSWAKGTVDAKASDKVRDEMAGVVNDYQTKKRKERRKLGLRSERLSIIVLSRRLGVFMPSRLCLQK